MESTYLSRVANRTLPLFLVFVLLVSLIAPAVQPAQAAGAFNYGEALQKSIFFYEAQAAGPKPAWSRVAWRGDAMTNDGSDVGIDLNGGWYDAGDHVKFGFPLASSVTLLAWGGVEYRQAYQDSGQLPYFLNNLRFVNDYFIKAHTAPNELYVQVGDGDWDHTKTGQWAAPEVKPSTVIARPSMKIDMTCPGPDVAAETAAAMAASSMVFKPSDPVYANTLLTHAKQLFAFAEATKGTDGKDNAYVNCLKTRYGTGIGFYNSTYGVYWDELAWGAAWLYRATNDADYLAKARLYYPKMGTENQTSTPVYTWSMGWNDKAYGVYVLMAQLTGESAFKTDAQRWLDWWSVGGGKRTPGGVIVVDSAGWGVLRYAANAAFLAFVYADYLGSTDPLYARYHDFAAKQINYALGDNPLNRSYVVGFGNNPPRNVHHRGAHGTWLGSMDSEPATSRHILYGALVGGPADDTTYSDKRNDWVANEVACDYNAGFTSALARMYKEYGGTPLANFPVAETPEVEYFVTAALNQSGSNSFTEVKALLQNRSAWPARITDKLSFRYFFTLEPGVSPSNISVITNMNDCGTGTATGPHLYAGSIYYIKVDCTGQNLYPGGQDPRTGRDAYRREVQFRITSTGAWDPTNDWSYSGLPAPGTTPITAPRIPVYDNGVLLYGLVPDGDATPPTAPTALTSPSQTSSSIALSWTASTDNVGVTGYDIYRNGTLVGSSTTTSFSDSGLTANTLYTYTVRAKDAAGNVSVASAALGVRTEVSNDTQAPTAPTALTSPSQTTTGIALSWTASTDNVGVTGYDIYRNGALAGSATTTSFSDSGLTADTLYTYTVKAKDAAGNVSAASAALAVRTKTNSVGACEVVYTISNQWNVGFTANVEVKNNGAPIVNTWTLNWTFPGNQVATSAWNAAVTQSGKNVTAVGTGWNGSIPTGGSASFGFQGTYSGANDKPTVFILNGVVCGGTTPDTEAPTAPTALASPSQTTTSIALSWTASTDNVGVTGYDIYRNGTLVGSATTTSFNNTGLTADTLYTYTVRAKDAAGNVSPVSAALGVRTRTAADTEAPTAPTGLASPSQTTTGIALSWTASTDNVGVTGYDIYRNGTLAGSSTTTAFSDSGLTADTLYTYTVKAKDAAGNVSAASAALGVRTRTAADTEAPTAPTALASPSQTTTSIALSWTASTDNVGVTGYDIYRNGTLAGNSSTTAFSDSGLTADTLYTYTVKAKDAAGNVSAASAALGVRTKAAADTEAPTAPTALASPSQTTTSIALSWTASTDNVGVTGYDIYRNGTLVGSAATTSFSDSGLTANTLYTYTVKAKDAAGNVSVASAALGVRTKTASGSTCEVVYTIGNQWGTGFIADVVIKNTGAPITSWTLNWTFPGNQTIANAWNTVATQSGAVVTAKNTGSNGSIATNGSVNFGFQGAYSGANDKPTTFVLNGVICGGGLDTEAPTAPTALTSPYQSSSAIRLSWTASTDNVGVTGYDIYRNGTLVGSSAGTVFTDTGLTADTLYTYTVTAKDAAGNVSAAGAALGVRTKVVPTIPAAPTGLTATVTSNSATLSWTASAGATDYDVYRNGTLVGSVIGVTFADMGLTASTRYTYTVRARNEAGTSAPSAALIVETTGQNLYLSRFLELYHEMRGTAANPNPNGYFSPKDIPYHSVETLICEAPDYGHETTSEAYSYWIWLEAMYGKVTGDWAPLAHAWSNMETYIIPSSLDQPSNAGYNPSKAATYAPEWPLPDNYPSPLDSGVSVGADPIYNELKTTYNTSDIYGMHWLIDVDNWYGYGQRGDGTSTPSYINTFQRGAQESVWETVPHPSWDEYKWGGTTGFLDLFVKESQPSAKQWRYTNAPDADARAVQAIYWAKQWADEQGGSATVNGLTVNAAKMGDYLRYSMFDKYFKKIGCTSPTCAAGTGYDSAHYLISWYYAWGGPTSGASWAWRIGSSHNHFGYQNPMAAYALSQVSYLKPASPNAARDWGTSLSRQLEFYRWLQTSNGAIAGGATNSWEGAYKTPPAGTSTFYGMAYDWQPVYHDPPSSEWFGMQAWSMERLAEYYYVTGDTKAKVILDKWVAWAMANTTINADGIHYSIPSTLVWGGQPALNWTATTQNWDPTDLTYNSQLTVSVKETTTDVGVTGAYVKALLFYAKKSGNTAAQQMGKDLLDRMWNLYRDDLGIATPEQRKDYNRFDDAVYVPTTWTGTNGQGATINSASTFMSIRPDYQNDPQWPLVQSYLNGGAAPTFTYHRFWAQSDIALAYATYAWLFP